MLVDLEDDHRIPIVPFNGGSVRVVPFYRHLGTRAVPNGAIEPEVVSRSGDAALATRALRKKFLCSDLPLATRVNGARATSHARLLSGAGTWPCYNRKAAQRAQGAYMAPLAAAAGHDYREDGGSPAVILSKVKQPTLSARVSAARLRFAARLAHAPGFMWGITASAGGDAWREALLSDLTQVYEMCQDRIENLPDPRVDSGPWMTVWRLRPDAWKGLVQLFERRAAEAVRSTALLSPIGVVENIPANEWHCYECGESFATVRGLRCHQIHRHGQRRSVNRLLFGSVCPTCRTDFRTHVRLAKHLTMGARKCVDAAAQGALPIASPEDILAAAAADRAERASARREARDECSGPPAFRLS
jgi:hypothetical protein